jgi:hypothetical protein
MEGETGDKRGGGKQPSNFGPFKVLNSRTKKPAPQMSGINTYAGREARDIRNVQTIFKPPTSSDPPAN